MPSTLNYSITYPSGTVAPNVPIVMQTQAESVDAALTALNAEKMARGLLYESKVIVNSGAFSTLTVVNNIPTFTFKAGRRYEIVWDGHHQSTVSGDIAEFQIATCATTDGAAVTTGLTVLRKKYFSCPTAGTLSPDNTKAALTYAVDTTKQIKFLMLRNTGSGSVQASATTDASILYQIYDVGAQTVLS